MAIYVKQVEQYFKEGGLEPCVFFIDSLGRHLAEEILMRKKLNYQLSSHELESDKLKLIIRGMQNA